jgi:hypothetical protein
MAICAAFERGGQQPSKDGSQPRLDRTRVSPASGRDPEPPPLSLARSGSYDLSAMLERLVHLRAHGTTVRTETLGSTTTFVTMACIMVVFGLPH